MMNGSDQSYLNQRPFPAYRGNKPYIFTSYAHADSAKVFAELVKFHGQGYPIWYDEGIEAGNKWGDEIANAISNCSLFIVFLTPQSAKSENVQDEIDFAISENRKVLPIHLEKTELTGGLKMKLQRVQAILRYAVSDDEYCRKYTSAFEACKVPMLEQLKNEAFMNSPFMPSFYSSPNSSGDSVTLEFINGPLSGQSFPYHTEVEVTLGHSSGCDIVIPENTVSGRHCQFNFSPPKVTVRDCGSKNGTFINDMLIGSRALYQSNPGPYENVSDGDTVKLSSKCSIIVHIQSEQTVTDAMGDESTVTDTSADENLPADAKQAEDQTSFRCFESGTFEYGFSCGSRTEKGPVRTSNQDAVVTCPEAAFFAVIDGVGGAAHGRETARYLSEKLPQVMRSLAHELSDSLSASIGAKLLRNKIAEISDSLYAEHSIDGKTDYSAAIACLWLVRKSAIVLHLGDCRIYILPKDTDNLLCLTKDHNRAFDAVASGNMTDYEARTAGLSSKLTRYVGMAPQAQLDVEVYPVTAGDQFLLCSDGLYSSVAENELTRIMREGMNEEEIPRRMVQTACDAGSRDNVTAQYVMILEK